MRVLSIVTLYNLLNVVLAQFDIINEDIGDLHFHAQVGNLPLKYIPLSEKDRTASDKVGEVIDLIQLVPKIDPLVLQSVPLLGIDLPFLWLSGQVQLSNFVLSGVKQLELNDVELRLINFRSDLNITVPQIYFEVDFYLQITLSFMPVLFSCHVSANLYDVGVTVSGGGYKVDAPSVGEVLQIDSVDIHLDINSVVFNLTNMVIGEEQELNRNLQQSPASQPLQPVQLFSRSSVKSDDNILNGLLKLAVEIANNELLKVPFEAFETYLTSDTY